MSKAKKTERIVALAKYLTDQPSRLFSLGRFCDEFAMAKSTLSEDIQIVRESFEFFDMGEVETVAGASGGVRYLPKYAPDKARDFLSHLAARLSEPGRIITGAYIYMSDILFDPAIAKVLGEIIYQRMAPRYKPDYIMTVETKGIPLALMTARAFGVPLVTARRDSRVTEGSSVSINYLSGSTRRIQAMSLPRRALPQGAGVIIVDDFMKAGGTAKGMVDLANEVGARVLGTCVLMSTKEPFAKMVKDYTALLSLNQVDEAGKRTEIDIFGSQEK